MRVRSRVRSRGRRGASMLLVTMVVTVIAMTTLALFQVVSSSQKAVKGSRDTVNAQLVAEAGLAEAMLQLTRGEGATLGSEDAPVAYGSAGFWVAETDLGGGVHSLVATGIENGVGAQLELVVREVSSSFFSWAAFGDERMTMSSNAQVDSYNSSFGSYDSQDVNGSGSSSFALTNGNVGSNGNVRMDQNSKVWGDVVPGPEGSATVLGNAVVTGSTTSASSEVEMPPIDLPTIPSSGDLTVAKNGSHAFGAGEHHIEDFLISSGAEVTVEGPATLVFDTFEIGSGAELTVDATNGPVEIFVVGDFVMNSNTLIASETWTPSDIEINLLSDNVIDPGLEVDLDEVDFDSNAKLYGTIYAPSASIVINSNFELFGSLVARAVHLDSNARIHFDEALLDVSEDEEITFETVAWRQRPFQVND